MGRGVGHGHAELAHAGRGADAGLAEAHGCDFHAERAELELLGAVRAQQCRRGGGDDARGRRVHEALVRGAAEVAHNARENLVRAVDFQIAVADVASGGGDDVVRRCGLAAPAGGEHAKRGAGALTRLHVEVEGCAFEALGAANVAAQQLRRRCTQRVGDVGSFGGVRLHVNEAVELSRCQHQNIG